MLNRAFGDLRQGLALYYVWVYQAYHDISAKYKRTALGSLWLSGSFVVTSLSLSILFGALFKQPLNVALPYTMSGILAYSLISFVFNEAAEMFMSSAGIIKNHAYPFTFYNFHSVCKSFFLFLHNLVVFWLFIVIIGAFSIPHWTLLFGLVVALVFILSWGMLMGMLAARFRDMRFMLPYVAQLFSILTPLFWRVDSIQGPVRTLIESSPFYQLVQVIREPLLGHAPTPMAWAVSIGSALLGVIFWLIFFPANRRRIPFWV